MLGTEQEDRFPLFESPKYPAPGTNQRYASPNTGLHSGTMLYSSRPIALCYVVPILLERTVDPHEVILRLPLLLNPNEFTVKRRSINGIILSLQELQNYVKALPNLSCESIIPRITRTIR